MTEGEKRPSSLDRSDPSRSHPLCILLRSLTHKTTFLNAVSKLSSQESGTLCVPLGETVSISTLWDF